MVGNGSRQPCKICFEILPNVIAMHGGSILEHPYTTAHRKLLQQRQHIQRISKQDYWSQSLRPSPLKNIVERRKGQKGKRGIKQSNGEKSNGQKTRKGEDNEGT